MKKIMAVVPALFVFAAFSFLAGCKKAEEPKAPEPAPAQPTEPAK